MGDQVIFATKESGVSSSGFNGFPFRLIKKTTPTWDGETFGSWWYFDSATAGFPCAYGDAINGVGSGSPFNARLSRQQSVALVWRIKKFTATGSLAIPYGETVAISSENATLESTRYSAGERDLITLPPGSPLFSGSIGYWNAQIGFYSSYASQLGQTRFLLPDESGDVYYTPFCMGDIDNITPDNSDPSTQIKQVWVSNETPVQPVGVGDGFYTTFPSTTHSADIQLFTTVDRSDAPSTFKIYGLTGSIDVFPSEYWPHKNAAGNPVWDATTGAILAPVS